MYIEVGKVTAVLLADEWHKVVPGSFKVGTYSFADSPDAQAPDSGVPGFQFSETTYNPARTPPADTLQVFGPLSAILAVRIPEDAS